MAAAIGKGVRNKNKEKTRFAGRVFSCEKFVLCLGKAWAVRKAGEYNPHAMLLCSGETRNKGASCVLTSSKRAEASRQTSRAYPPSPPCGFSSSPKISCGHFWGCPCKVKSRRGTFRLRTQSATLLRVLTVDGFARQSESR